MKNMGRELPIQAVVDRDELIREIEDAFSGVRLGSGTSWGEATALLEGGEGFIYPKRDEGVEWTSLIKNWNSGHRGEVWLLLDSIGFRYYLPAAMIQCLQGGAGPGLCQSLTLPLAGDFEAHRQRWSSLGAPQRRCVRRFLEHMVSRTYGGTESFEIERWREALESEWEFDSSE